MSNADNLKGKGFHERSADEVREIARRGGKASGETRRRKANFRRMLNMLLTVKVDGTDWAAFLESMGIEPTLEAAVNAAMIRKALAGDVKAYEAIARYSGQSHQTKMDDAEQVARTKHFKTKTAKMADKAEGDEDGVEIINDVK